MAILSPDTHPVIEEMQIQIIRRMPPWKKVAVMDGLCTMLKAAAISDLRHRYPDASAEQIRRLYAALVLGEPLAHAVYDCSW